MKLGTKVTMVKTRAEGGMEVMNPEKEAIEKFTAEGEVVFDSLLRFTVWSRYSNSLIHFDKHSPSGTAASPKGWTLFEIEGQFHSDLINRVEPKSLIIYDIEV